MQPTFSSQISDFSPLQALLNPRKAELKFNRVPTLTRLRQVHRSEDAVVTWEIKESIKPFPDRTIALQHITNA